MGRTIGQKMLPQYMEEILKLPITENGLYSSIPNIASLVGTFGAAVLADFLIKKRIKVIRVRKLMHCIGCIGGIAFIIPVGFLSCHDLELAIFCLASWLGIAAFERAGAVVSLVDVVPRESRAMLKFYDTLKDGFGIHRSSNRNWVLTMCTVGNLYAGLAMGIVNTVGNIPGMIVPSIVTAMTPSGSQSEWRNVFFMTAGIYIFSGFTYLILGSGEIEEWAKNPVQADGGFQSKVKENSNFNPMFTISNHEKVTEKDFDQIVISHENEGVMNSVGATDQTYL